MGLRQNQSPTSSGTDNVQLEDETLATNRAATAVPLVIGEAKTVIRWITPIYGQHTKKAPRKETDKAK